MSALSFPGSFWLLTPLLWVAAIFLLLLAVRSVLQNRSLRKWRDRETIEWGPPRPSLIQRWSTKMGRIRFRLPRFSQRQIPEIAPKPTPLAPAAAPADPLKKPTQPMLALFGLPINGSTFGAPETKPKEAFAWEKTKGIE